MFKNTISVAIIVLVSFAFFACGGSGGDSDGPKSAPSQDDPEPQEAKILSENLTDIDQDKIQVNAEVDTYLTFLEPVGTSEEINLTGEIGYDVFSYVYDRDIVHTFCWEEQIPEYAHSMTIFDNSGAEVLSVDGNAGCVTETIAPGIYEVIVTHNGLSDEIYPIFFVPQSEGMVKNSHGIEDMLFSKFKNLLSFVSLSEISHAQTAASEVTTMITTNSCLNCDLRNLNVRGQSLFGVNLAAANLASSILDEADLRFSILTGANLFSSDIAATNFTGADLRAVDFRVAEIDMCTNFYDADLTGAIWIEGCVCADDFCTNCDDLPFSFAEGEIEDGTDCVQNDGPIVLPN